MEVKDLNLKRPVVFFDLETTGTDPVEARVVEITMIRLNPDGQMDEYTHLVNPECHIPEEASEVNHITDETVKDCPTFGMLANEIKDFIGESDLGGYNIKGYDITCLSQNFARVGVQWSWRGRLVLDGFPIFCKREPRNLTAALKYYCGENLEDAHSAAADTKASIKVLLGQMEMYGIKTIEEVSQEALEGLCDLSGVLIQNKEGVPSFRVGKYKGQTLQQVWNEHWDYIDWALNKSNFAPDTKAFIRQEIRKYEKA